VSLPITTACLAQNPGFREPRSRTIGWRTQKRLLRYGRHLSVPCGPQQVECVHAQATPASLQPHTYLRRATLPVANTERQGCGNAGARSRVDERMQAFENRTLRLWPTLLPLDTTEKLSRIAESWAIPGRSSAKFPLANDGPRNSWTALEAVPHGRRCDTWESAPMARDLQGQSFLWQT
jgi:hypothetical protein